MTTAFTPINSPQAVCIGPTGEVEWFKAPDATDYTVMSVAKAFTAYYALESGGFPDLTITRTRTSGPAPSPTAVAQGDVVTVSDEIHAMMLPSDNYGADAVAAWFAAVTGTSFMPAARTWYAATFGWTGFTYSTPSGMGTDIFSARMVAEMGLAIATTQPWLVEVMGKTTEALQVGGTNARTVTLTHTMAQYVDTFESTGGIWAGSKSGSGSGTHAGVILWRDPDDALHSIGILGSPSGPARATDVAAIIGDVMARGEWGDPPPSSGLFRTSGNPVALARTNGNPVTLTA